MNKNFNQLLKQKLIENFHKKMLAEQVPGPYIPSNPPGPPPPGDYNPMNPSGPDAFPPVTIDPDTGKPTRWYWPNEDRPWWLPPNWATNPFRPTAKPPIRRPGFDAFDPAWQLPNQPNVSPRPWIPPQGWQPGQYGR